MMLFVLTAPSHDPFIILLESLIFVTWKHIYFPLKMSTILLNFIHNYSLCVCILRT